MSVHEVGKKLEGAINRLKEHPDISDRNKDLILEFKDQLFAEGLTKHRVLFYVSRLYKTSMYLGKDFDDTDKPDIKKLVSKIERKEDYSAETKKDYKVAIKRFYRWLENGDGSEYPEKVKWINTTLKNKRKKLPEEILTKEEIRKLIKEAKHPRDKALISVLYESGARIGELLSLKLKHVTFDDFGAKLIVEGKTGMRRTRLISSIKYLTTYLENHPDNENPNSPLWVTIGTNQHGSQISYRRVRNLLKDLAEKADVSKAVNPHAFRHARATELASELTEAQMCEYFGWVQGSDQPATYVHLSGKNLDNTLLKMHGFEPENGGNKETITCPRCNEENKSSAKFCAECGQPLDLKSSLDLKDKKRKADENLQKFLETLKKKTSEDEELKKKLADLFE